MTADKPRILFFGTPAFGAKVLESLYSFGFNVSGIVTQPTKKGGRGNLLSSSKVKETADKYGLLLYQPSTKNEITSITDHIKPDLIITAAYGQILPPDTLNIPKYGALNVHGSLLPRYRGASPVAATILNGDKETGITIMKMSDNLDAGPIVSQVKIKINPKETTESLYEKLTEAGAEELIRAIPLYVNGDLRPHEQDHNKATYCSVIKKKDGQIDWNRSAVDIERTIRAFIPWPHAFTNWNSRLLKILEADVVEKALEPGYVIALEKSFLVGCGINSLEVTKIQLEGKKETSVADFLNGYRDIDGSTLTS